MNLSLYRDGNNLADPSELVSPDNFVLHLVPNPPKLEMDFTELLERRDTPILHVQIRSECGRLAHVHLSLRTTDEGQVRAEVSVSSPSRTPMRASRVARWREPVNP